jgi:protein-tyrosine phosphatase
LKERGCEFQVNLLSLAGYYGKPTRENATRLFKEGLVDYLATDMHHEKHADLLATALPQRGFNKVLSRHIDQLKNKQLKTGYGS